MTHPLVMGNVEPNRLARELGLTPHEEGFVERNRLFNDGDHWQGGAGYIGPPPDMLDPNRNELWARLRRAFTSSNIVKEINDRQAAAIFGNVPDYGFTVRRPLGRVPRMIPDPAFVAPPDDPQAEAPLIEDPSGATEPEQPNADELKLIAEAQAAMEIFYSRRKPLRYLKKLLKARLWGGRAYLRLYVPKKFRVNGRFAARDLNEAVERIFISQPDIKDAAKLEDDESADELSIYRYTRDETPGQEGGPKTTVFELSFTDDLNRTYVATITQQQPSDLTAGPFALLPASPFGAAADAEARSRVLANIPEDNISDPLDLNGHLTHYEMSGDPLITEQITSNNASHNLNLTMANHVTVDNGFREFAVTNVEFETEKVSDGRGGTKEVPKRIKRGHGLVHNFWGRTEVNEQTGAETFAEPDIKAFDPVDIKSFDAGAYLYRRNCYHEAHQLHALITGDAAPSGESRIQALADFVMFSLDFKEEGDDAGAWLFEAVLFWAAALIGKPGRFNGLRCNFSTRIYAGKLTADERRLLLEEVEKRIRSRANYQMQVDITDPDEENARIVAEDSQLDPIGQERAKLALEADRRALGSGDSGGGE